MRSTNALSPQAESKPKTCAARTDAIRLLRRSAICGRCSKSILLRAVTPALRTERSSSALLWLVNERTPFESKTYAEQAPSRVISIAPSISLTTNMVADGWAHRGISAPSVFESHSFAAALEISQIGRASGRERVCQYV